MLLDRCVPVGPFQCNCRLLACPKSGEAVVIDPGDEPEKLLKLLRGARVGPSGPLIRVKYLFHTHGHLDHIGAARPVREALAEDGAKSNPAVTAPRIALHRDDEELYLALRRQAALFKMSHYLDPLPVDHYFQDEEEIRVGELRFTILHTPGHSPGSVCLRLHENSAIGVREALFSGDTLFQGSVGRTDLWGGDSDLMFRSIRQRLLVLDDETRVCPGHGPETRIGIEKRENPFL